jgi:hypothetical protein
MMVEDQIFTLSLSLACLDYFPLREYLCMHMCVCARVRAVFSYSKRLSHNYAK